MSPTARRFFGCALPLILAVFGCISLAMLSWASQVFVTVQEAPDAAMAPTIPRGHTVIVNNTAFWNTEPRRGHVAYLQRPEGRVLRRIVGVPGEVIAIRDGVVLVDGEPRTAGDLVPGTEPGPDADPIELGPDEYFVLSDNRAVADSRTWGPIAREDIFGNVRFAIDQSGRVDVISQDTG